MSGKPSIRFFLSMVLTLGLIAASQLPFANQLAVAGYSRSAAADLNLKSESQLKSEAALYDTAIREIGRISSMHLSNTDESKAAIAIMDKQARDLRLIRSKLIVLGLSDSTFANAVRSKAGDDKKTQQEFAVELAKDRASILKLSGAASLKSRIEQKVEADGSLLRRVSDQFKQAAAEIKAKPKGHHVSRTTSDYISARDVFDARPTLSPTPRLTNAEIGDLVIVAAVIVFPPLGLALADIVANTAVILFAEAVGGAVVELLADLKAAAGTKKENDALAACFDQAAAADDKCETAARKLIFPLNLAALDVCEGSYIFATAACLLE